MKRALDWVFGIALAVVLVLLVLSDPLSAGLGLGLAAVMLLAVRVLTGPTRFVAPAAAGVLGILRLYEVALFMLWMGYFATMIHAQRQARRDRDRLQTVAGDTARVLIDALPRRPGETIRP